MKRFHHQYIIRHRSNCKKVFIRFLSAVLFLCLHFKVSRSNLSFTKNPRFMKSNEQFNASPNVRRTLQINQKEKNSKKLKWYTFFKMIIITRYISMKINSFRKLCFVWIRTRNDKSTNLISSIIFNR